MRPVPIIRLLTGRLRSTTLWTRPSRTHWSSSLRVRRPRPPRLLGELRISAPPAARPSASEVTVDSPIALLFAKHYLQVTPHEQDYIFVKDLNARCARPPARLPQQRVRSRRMHAWQVPRVRGRRD
jgi:hypothetical protein